MALAGRKIENKGQKESGTVPGLDRPARIQAQGGYGTGKCHVKFGKTDGEEIQPRLSGKFNDNPESLFAPTPRIQPPAGPFNGENG